MDDDIIAFLLIFVASMALIIGVVASVYNTLNPLPHQRIPSVMVLRTPDVLKNRQIVKMPTVIPGRLNPAVNWVCYFYHEEGFIQRVIFNWWLGFQMEEEMQYVSFYSSLGENFIIQPHEKLECFVSFTVKDGTPKQALNKLEESQIWLDVRVEVVESG